ncbi:MAG: hypothetical protein Ct9H300mP1_30160 [Planctomycetaceae bacterium]|nr:MAG: hypothetical protein Ct9H300mP1_30160 [Planctomycetaceae bacterium]
MWYGGPFVSRDPGNRDSRGMTGCIAGTPKARTGSIGGACHESSRVEGVETEQIVPYFAHAPLLFRDDADPDVSRRYKGFYFWNSGQHMEIARTGKYGRKYDPRDEHFLMDLLTSPDGIPLDQARGEKPLSPGKQAKPFSAIPQSVFRDVAEPDPQKRFKAYGFMSLNVRRRGTCCLTSPDALHWTAHPEMPLIDPAIRGIPRRSAVPPARCMTRCAFRIQVIISRCIKISVIRSTCRSNSPSAVIWKHSITCARAKRSFPLAMRGLFTP